VAIGIEDYNLLMLGNESLLAECNELCYHTEDLDSELAKVRTDAAEDIAALGAKLKSTEAHNMDIAAAGEKHLKDFENELVKDLAGLRALYTCNIQSIEGLCTLMLESEPSAMDYIRWLSTQIAGLPKVFSGVNKKFISAAVEGTLVVAGDSVDLASL
jgi:hypothetical protein